MTDIYGWLPELSKAELESSAKVFFAGHLGLLPRERIAEMLTLATFFSDLCINELERRGHLELSPDGGAIIPYCSEHAVETILTRPQSRKLNG